MLLISLILGLKTCGFLHFNGYYKGETKNGKRDGDYDWSVWNMGKNMRTKPLQKARSRSVG